MHRTDQFGARLNSLKTSLYLHQTMWCKCIAVSEEAGVWVCMYHVYILGALEAELNAGDLFENAFFLGNST